jgi:signal transduction histidine kinase
MAQRAEGGNDGAGQGTAVQGWRKVLRALVAGSAEIVDVADRERAELLASLSLAVLVLGFTSGLVQWLLIPNFWPTFAAMLLALAVIGGAYSVSRSRHFRGAAWASAVAPIVACAVVLRNDPEDAVAGPFMLIGVLLATLFLNTRSALCIAAAAFVGLAAALAPWRSELNLRRAIPLLAFHAVLSPLLLMAAAYRDRIEELRKEALRRKQAELHEARQMELLGRLAGGIAHDFNNLLTVVVGNTEILTRLGDERTRELTADIASAATRGAGLTRQLLTTARKQLLQPRRVDLKQIVRDVEGLLGRLLGSHIELRIELADELPSVLADPSQLEQVILNLALNGRDAMPKGGTLRIAASHLTAREAAAPQGWVIISVSDTGVGMDPGTRENIFKPFFTTKGAAGHGLGLATVQGIVAQSGGRIEVASAPGHGAQFTIYLPVAVPGEAPEHAAAPPWPQRHQKSNKAAILVVDDDALVRRAVEHMLRGADYSVRSVSTAAEALELFEREQAQIDLLLCDVLVPDLSPVELARRLRGTKSGLPVLFMSGAGSRGAEAALALPGTSLIPKPFIREALRQEIEQILGPRASLRAASSSAAAGAPPSV